MSRNFKKVKAVLLREKWQPSDRCYVLLEKKGITREFAGHCMEAFKMHFLDSGVSRPGWDRSFLRWVKGDWENADKTRMYGEKKQPTMKQWTEDPESKKPMKPIQSYWIEKALTKEQKTIFADELASLVRQLPGGVSK